MAGIVVKTMQSESSTTSVLLVDATGLPTPTTNGCPLCYKSPPTQKQSVVATKSVFKSLNYYHVDGFIIAYCIKKWRCIKRQKLSWENSKFFM